MIKFNPLNFAALMIVMTVAIMAAENMPIWLLFLNLIAIFMNAMTSFANVLEGETENNNG